MPVLFLGHGSPMNAIEENEFVAGFRKIGEEIPKPNAILCISAHWETRGTWVTAMEKPKTIHDFGGFPIGRAYPGAFSAAFIHAGLERRQRRGEFFQRQSGGWFFDDDFGEDRRGLRQEKEKLMMLPLQHIAPLKNFA